MTTIGDCIKAKLLQAVKVRLLPHQQTMRTLVATPRSIEWMSTVLRTLVTDGYVDGAVTPLEQAATLFNRFIAGEDFNPPLPHEMDPKGHGIWEVRTADLRFFGWFPAKGTFVLSAVATKADCKDHGLYAGYFNQAVADRARINLMGGSYVAGGMNDVI